MPVSYQIRRALMKETISFEKVPDMREDNKSQRMAFITLENERYILCVYVFENGVHEN